MWMKKKKEMWTPGMKRYPDCDGIWLMEIHLKHNTNNQEKK